MFPLAKSPLTFLCIDRCIPLRRILTLTPIGRNVLGFYSLFQREENFLFGQQACNPCQTTFFPSLAFRLGHERNTRIPHIRTFFLFEIALFVPITLNLQTIGRRLTQQAVTAPFLSPIYLRSSPHPSPPDPLDMYALHAIHSCHHRRRQYPLLLLLLLLVLPHLYLPGLLRQLLKQRLFVRSNRESQQSQKDGT